MKDQADQTRSAREAQAGGWSRPRLQTSGFQPSSGTGNSSGTTVRKAGSDRCRRQTTVLWGEMRCDHYELIFIHLLSSRRLFQIGMPAREPAHVRDTALRSSTMAGRGGTYIIHLKACARAQPLIPAKTRRKTRYVPSWRQQRASRIQSQFPPHLFCINVLPNACRSNLHSVFDAVIKRKTFHEADKQATSCFLTANSNAFLLTT